MSYWILVFNQRVIGEIDPDRLLDAVAGSNFRTLCKQYGLDPALIDPALENLSIINSPGGSALKFMLRYRPEGQPPIGVYGWGINSEAGRDILSQALTIASSEAVCEALRAAEQVLGIELFPIQLQDMGLLLGYELARFAADQGRGIIQGLDGIWYRLNRHCAFLPFDTAAS